MLSRPSRARGLKHKKIMLHDFVEKVAPLAGAWIETREGKAIQRGNYIVCPYFQMDPDAIFYHPHVLTGRLRLSKENMDMLIFRYDLEDVEYLSF